MRTKTSFIRACKEFEPIYDAPSLCRMMGEDYKARDLQRTPTTPKVVYDCNETASPFYQFGEYLKTEDQILLPPTKETAVYNKSNLNRYYEKLNPYYPLIDAQDDTL